MISRNQRINAFIQLGNFLTDPKHVLEIEDWITSANRRNNWFTPENSALSLAAIGTEFLNPQKLTAWADRYHEPDQIKKVGVIMAGNIPAVGFHDALSVLISGHILLAKPSSDDLVLIQMLLEKLAELEPAFTENIQFVDRLNDADAYIATGSNNTARYFHYYFSKNQTLFAKTGLLSVYSQVLKVQTNWRRWERIFFSTSDWDAGTYPNYSFRQDMILPSFTNPLQDSPTLVFITTNTLIITNTTNQFC